MPDRTVRLPLTLLFIKYTQLTHLLDNIAPSHTSHPLLHVLSPVNLLQRGGVRLVERNAAGCGGVGCKGMDIWCGVGRGSGACRGGMAVVEELGLVLGLG